MTYDIHRNVPNYPLEINRVGVSGLDFPLTLKRKDGGNCEVNSKFDMFGSLLRVKKGIDMSRFPETLMEWINKPLSGENFEEFLRSLQVNVRAGDVFISSQFNYLIKKITPISQKNMIATYKCRFIGLVYKSQYNFFQEVKVPITSVCPCSKNMSTLDNLSLEELKKIIGNTFNKNDEKILKKCSRLLNGKIGLGAHNQRGEITLQVKCNPGEVWLEDLIEVSENSGSCEIYPLLKRPDEKYVTEKAYNNPKFVEDIAREVAGKLLITSNISWFRVKVENFESIHNHSATCYLERNKNGYRWYKTEKGFV